MIIDCILDRIDGATYGDTYDAGNFYRDMLSYGGYWGRKISAAMDYGTENDVRQALCGYIGTEYNPLIKDYIDAVTWLEPMPLNAEIRAAVDFKVADELAWAMRDAVKAAG